MKKFQVCNPGRETVHNFCIGLSIVHANITGSEVYTNFLYEIIISHLRVFITYFLLLFQTFAFLF